MQKVSYVANGETTIFYFNFPYFEKDNIVVTVNNGPAPSYNLIGIKGGTNPDFPFTSGKIVFQKPPKHFDTITIERHLPLVRPVDHQPLAKITSTILNQDMNYTIELLKDIRDDLEAFNINYADIVNKESTALLIEKIDLVNQNIADIAEGIEAFESIPDIQSDLVELQENIKTVNSGLSDCINSIQLLNNKTAGVIDYVISSQEPTSSNNYTWYRKYKSGWVEQGGIVSINAADSTIIALPIPMADTNYQVMAMNEPTDSINAWGWVFTKKNSKTTTGFALSSRYGSGQEVALQAHWQASGISA